MILKILPVIFISLIFTTNIRSQSTKFLDTSKMWSVLHENSSVHIHPDDPFPFLKTSWYKMGDDTLTDNKIYNHLLRSDDSLQDRWTKYGAVREEEGKVYYLNPALSQADQEILLYDFTLNAGDTVQLSQVLQYGNLFNYILDSTGVYDSGTSILKSWHFSVFNETNPETKIPETWIEGIGSLNGLLRESCFSMTPCNDNYELLCFQENDVLLYSTPANDYCFIDTLLVSVKPPKLGYDIRIYPNPARDKITIYSQISRILEVEIYDLSGTCLYRKFNTNSNRIDLETDNLSKGMYVLKVRDERDKISRKIVIQ